MNGEIVLPWPPRELHPNARVHWSKRAKAAKSARRYAYAETIQLVRKHGDPVPDRLAQPAGRLHVWIDAYPPDRRRRDTDGVLSSLKSALDGIADALGVDDQRFVPHPWVKDEVRASGEVRIRITGGPQ